MKETPSIVVLGASGLIGQAVAQYLSANGLKTTSVARRFTKAQKNAFGAYGVECPFATLQPSELARVLGDADVVVNCVGILQDGPKGRTDHVHIAFVERLLKAIEIRSSSCLLVHLSIPGDEAEDATDFSRTKRRADRSIADGPNPHAIIRPGFVIAPTAYGGSALVRGIASMPFDLPRRDRARPFGTTDIADVAETIEMVARRWGQGGGDLRADWDIMDSRSVTLGEVVDRFRHHFGGPKPWVSLPAWAMSVGAHLGDAAAWFGWSPPIRTTALREMRRGVSGDPSQWIADTELVPTSLEQALMRCVGSVQETWFSRLYLLKPLIVASLAVFWTVSGLIALFPAFDAATRILIDHGFPEGLAVAVTVSSSLMDIAVGLAIVFRRTCRIGLMAGIAVSVIYMVGAAVIAPDMWIEPLGALVKTGPAIILMLVALAMYDDR